MNCFIDPSFHVNYREDTWRILIATDSHLGYLERDQIRRDDSFDALEEILCLAESEQVRFSSSSYLLFAFSVLRLCLSMLGD